MVLGAWQLYTAKKMVLMLSGHAYPTSNEDILANWLLFEVFGYSRAVAGIRYPLTSVLFRR